MIPTLIFPQSYTRMKGHFVTKLFAIFVLRIFVFLRKITHLRNLTSSYDYFRKLHPKLVNIYRLHTRGYESSLMARGNL